MTLNFKKDEVTVSFHYLMREIKNEKGESIQVAFTKDEFASIHEGLVKAKSLDINDEVINTRIKNRTLAPIESVEKINDRTISGVYKGSYWGHSYENTVRGNIPADSINLRPFYFLLYLAKSGRVYVASQYLGNFGGYTSIRNTIFSLLSNRNQVSSSSFNFGNIVYKDAIAKEVEITFSRQGNKITDSNTFGKSGAFTFKKRSKDDGFEKAVNKQVLSLTGKAPSEVKKMLSRFLKSHDLAEMKDDEIKDCKVIVQVDGRQKTIHLFNESNFATRFPISVGLNDDGHPLYDPLKNEVIKILRNEVITRKENV